MKIGDLFDVSFGSKLDLVNLVQVDTGGVNFVSRGQKNNGVSARVATLSNIAPYPAGCLTVALGGSIFETFLQPEPFYTSQNVAVLVPKVPMSEHVLLFYCAAIAKNKYRFTYGRHANRTVKDVSIPAPSELPHWIQGAKTVDITDLAAPANPSNAPLDLFGQVRGLFRVRDLFDISGGSNLELNTLSQSNASIGVNFVSRTGKNNGVSAIVNPVVSAITSPGGVLSVALGGSVLETFYQEDPFYTGRDIAVLKPKITPDKPAAALLYVATVIRANRYRYAYGRQANRTLGDLVIRLPAQSIGGALAPDWKYMADFIESLPYSSQLLA
ncbi:restriction endonuclease subunit S [Stenotrophomonas lactitubi]|uniref:restriction endonuclease subunit S n=1 Tax=Stenotrophomonas lactitubi TaxID=2045214 RepID=UPI00203C7CEB|nr:restriction endonuclease subunit S [Stenotrophomonas lactitubi]